MRIREVYKPFYVFFKIGFWLVTINVLFELKFNFVFIQRELNGKREANISCIT